jgi:hypothetical protein
VGGVSGELFLMDGARDGAPVEMGVYWTYEKWIRKAESRSGSVVGATGAIYAIRRGLYQPLPEDTLLDDVLTPLNIIMQGHRGFMKAAPRCTIMCPAMFSRSGGARSVLLQATGSY